MLKPTFDLDALGGMERSFSNFMELILRKSRDFEAVEFLIPSLKWSNYSPHKNVSFFKSHIEENECPEKYIKFGDGKSKWDHLLNDKNIFNSITSYSGRIDLIHDQSSSTVPALIGKILKVPVVKTVRLPSFHPSTALVWDDLAGKIFLSKYQIDSYTHGKLGVFDVIPDIYIPVSSLPCNTKNGRAVSVGRIEIRKGILEVCRIAASLGKQVDFIGEIIDESLVYEIKEKYGEMALFWGPMGIEKVHKAIADSDVLIWAPLFPEPGGRVVIEALKLGTKVYAKPIGYAADIYSSLKKIKLSDEESDILTNHNCVLLNSSDLIVTESAETLYLEKHINLYQKLIRR